ncbi:MAG: helix-turn-helix transcriptional regulator [Sphingobacteriales bacterium]|jgi:putative transcriptional regulator
MKNILKEERLKNELTQVELAEMVGVSRQTIFSIEISKYVPSVTLSLKLARALGKTVEQLFILEKTD